MEETSGSEGKIVIGKVPRKDKGGGCGGRWLDGEGGCSRGDTIAIHRELEERRERIVRGIKVQELGERVVVGGKSEPRLDWDVINAQLVQRNRRRDDP